MKKVTLLLALIISLATQAQSTYKTNNYTYRTGSLIFQPYSLNNEFISENSYFNGAAWTRLSTGFSSSIQLYNGQVLFYGAPSGSGTFIPIISLKTDHAGAGTVALGGSISTLSTDYTGAKLVVVGNGNVISNTGLVFGTDNTYDIGASGATRPRAIYVAGTGTFGGAVQSLYDRFGAGSPEGVVSAPVGAHYHNTTGGAGTSTYFKETGAAGNTGWVAK